MRKLGIPTVVDRLIQQAILQVLSPIYDPTFSESSYGFRPKRSAHDGVRAAKRHVAEGGRWAWNGRGAWWNSGASHMNEAFPVF